jgi:hypothetical protein
VRARDFWTRDRDGTVVYVEVVADSLEDGEGRLVSWLAPATGHQNICTEVWFLRHYTLQDRVN